MLLGLAAPVLGRADWRCVWSAGVDWQRVREQTPPELVPPPPGTDDAEDLNWEFTSMLSALPIQYSYSDSAPDLLPGSGAGRAAAEDGAPAGARPAHDDECLSPQGEASSASGSRVPAPGEGAQVRAAADEGSGEAALACASAGGGGLCRNGIAGARRACAARGGHCCGVWRRQASRLRGSAARPACGPAGHQVQLARHAHAGGGARRVLLFVAG